MFRLSNSFFRFKNMTNFLYLKFLSEKGCAKHSCYGKIYLPIYNLYAPIQYDSPPEIYNKDGLAMYMFFIRDSHFAHSIGPKSKYFIWDRYNIGLDTHFYTHKNMLKTMGKPKKQGRKTA